MRRYRTRRTTTVAIAASIGLMLAGIADSRPIPPQMPVEPVDTTATAYVAQRGGVSLDEAIEIAKRRQSGRVVRAVTIMRNGRRVHEVRILGDDGRVRTVYIDAERREGR